MVYAGLGHTSLRDRIEDAQARVVIVGDAGIRRGTPVPTTRSSGRAGVPDTGRASPADGHEATCTVSTSITARSYLESSDASQSPTEQRCWR